MSLSNEQTDHLPGDFAIWIFIFAELLVFGVLFVVYAFTRAGHVELFNATQLELDRVSGMVNTVALITASYFMVRSVAAIRRGAVQACRYWMLAALVSGAVFVVVKTVEFHAKFSAGINLSTNLFYTFYLSLTFFHYAHVWLGLIILGAVWFKARRGAYSAREYTGVETGASYWHMVDLVWVILFPLVYIMR